MLQSPLHQNRDGFIHFATNDTPPYGASLRRRAHLADITWLMITHALILSISVIRVFIRAISRRTLLNLEGLASCPVHRCIRRLNCSFRNSSSSDSNSVVDNEAIFSLSAILSGLTFYKGSGDGKFGTRQAQCFSCKRLTYPLKFVQHRPRLNQRNPIFRVTLSLTHPHFQRLL